MAARFEHLFVDLDGLVGRVLGAARHMRDHALGDFDFELGRVTDEADFLLVL